MIRRRDRATELRDAEHFVTEAIRRLERLVRIESDNRQRSSWQQAAAAERQIRKELRRVANADRARRRQERLTKR